MPELSWPTGLLLALFCLPVLATLLSLSSHDHWIARIFDFPRLQIAVLNLAAIPIGYLNAGAYLPAQILIAANALCALWQFWQISAYTRLRRPTVSAYHGTDNGRTVSILTSNVLTPNRQADRLLRLIEQYRPDIVLTLETDQWWETQLAGLEEHYRWQVKIPLDNLYGMHLYSRLPLRDARVMYRVRPDIPSIRADARLDSGEWIRLYCLHPMPPSPTESETATERDGELLLVGKEIAANPHSCLVFGDLNDVAWSDTSRLFQRISGLLDPRIGRGLYNTFHANWRLLRWPLDHIFHSKDFQVAQLRVLPHIGSDHFPVYGKFQYCPAADQPEPVPECGDHTLAAEKIAAADPIHATERIKYPDPSEKPPAT